VKVEEDKVRLELGKNTLDLAGVRQPKYIVDRLLQVSLQELDIGRIVVHDQDPRAQLAAASPAYPAAQEPECYRHSLIQALFDLT
jgi:hypothetical protein